MLEEVFAEGPISFQTVDDQNTVEKTTVAKDTKASEDYDDAEESEDGGQEEENEEEEEEDEDEDEYEAMDVKPMIDASGKVVRFEDAEIPQLVDLTDEEEKRVSVRDIVNKIENVEIAKSPEEPPFDMEPWEGEEEYFWSKDSALEEQTTAEVSSSVSQHQMDSSVPSGQNVETCVGTEEFVMQEIYRREDGILKTYYMKVRKSEKPTIAPVTCYSDISDDNDDDDYDDDDNDNEEKYVSIARSDEEKKLLRQFRENREKSSSPSKAGKACVKSDDALEDGDSAKSTRSSWRVDVFEGGEEKSMSGRGRRLGSDPPPYSRDVFVHAGFDAVSGLEYFKKVSAPVDPPPSDAESGRRHETINPVASASTSSASITAAHSLSGTPSATGGGGSSGIPTSNPPSRRRALGDNPVETFPGFEEIGVGFVLKHMTGGPVVGGYPDHTIHRHLYRITEKINFDKKSTDDEILSYKREERKFLNLLKSGCNAETSIYTLVGLFLQKVQNKYSHVANRLAEKQSYFTSFRHFIREFRVAQWPNIKQHSTLVAVNNKQKANESIEAFYERHIDIMEEAGRDLDDTIEEFISGIYNKKVRETVRLHDYGAVRTLDQVRNFSSKTVQNLQAERVFNGTDKASSYYQPGGKRQKWSKISSTTSSGNPKGQPKGKESSKGKKSQPRPGTSAQGKQPKPQAPKKPKAPAPSAAAVDAGDRQAAAAGQEMKTFNLTGCYCCLGAKHTYDERNKDQCRKLCPYCGTPLDGQNKHYAILCPKRPNERKLILRGLSNKNPR